MRWTLIFALTLVVAGLFITWIGDDGTSRQMMPRNELIQLGIRVLGWGAVGILAFSGFIYAISWGSRVRVDQNEISGRTYWGFKVRFPSNSVTAVRQTRNQGVRYLWVSSDATSKQLSLVLLGVTPSEYIDDLSQILGAEHKLTEWFLANAKS